jgi:hypothetical protein
MKRFKKLRYIHKGENIFVNPAWNLGVKESKKENLIIVNDDVIIPNSLINRMSEELDVYEIVGMHPESMNSKVLLYDTIHPGPHIGHGWGCCIFMKKYLWEDIPEGLNVWFGDNWICKNQKCYSFKSNVEGDISVTVNSEGISDIIKKDIEAWNGKRDYIFVHIPKTGGTSVNSALYKFDHLNQVRDYCKARVSRNGDHQVYEKKPGDPFSFCVSRNPFSRCVSAFNYLKTGGSNPLDRADGDKYCDYETFEDFVMNGLDEASLNQIHFLPQHTFIPFGVDVVGKLEDISDFCELISEKLVGEDINMPHSNKGPECDYKSCYSSEDVIKKVVSVYEKDFEYFGYDKKI